MCDTLTMYDQVAAVKRSVSPLTAAAAAGAAVATSCRVHLCQPTLHIYDINCPSAVFAARTGVRQSADLEVVASLVMIRKPAATAASETGRCGGQPNMTT